MAGRSVKKVTLVLFSLKFASLIVSLFTLSYSIKYFGVSSERDIWILITAFLLALSGGVFGPLNETFRAKFTSMKVEEGEKESLQKLREMIGLVVLLALVLSGLLYIFPTFFAKIVAPIASDNSVFFEMLIVLIPTLLLNQLIAIGMSVLNTYDIFYIPEVVGFFSGIIALSCIYFLAPTFGIYSLVVSQYIGLFINFSVIFFYLHRLKLNVFPRFNIKWINVSPFILFSLPFFFPYFVGQVNIILEKSLANLLGSGMVSTIDYSRKLTMILQQVTISVLASIMVPDLAKIFYDKEKSENDFNKTIRKYFEIILLILALSIPMLIGAASALSDFLFLRGDIDTEKANQIAQLMRVYGTSFVGILLYLFFGLVMLAQNRGKQYATIGVLAQVLVIVLNLGFYEMLGEYVFPISIGIAHFIAAIGLFLFAKGINRREILTLLGKVVIIVLLLIIVVYIETQYLKDFNSMIVLAINGLTVLGLVVLIIFPLVGIDIKNISKQWRKKISH